MIRGLTLSAVLLVAIVAPVRAADEKPALEPGNYIVYYAFQSSSPEQAFALIKVEKKGGNLVGSLEASPPTLTGSTLKEFTVDGRDVYLALDLNGRVLTFEGMVTKDNKSALGSFGDDRLLSRGRLVPTDKTTIERTELSIPAKVAEPLAKLNKLTTSINALRFKVQQAKGDEAIAAAKKALEDAQKELKEETEKRPQLYKEVLEKHADSPQVIEAAVSLLRTAKGEEVAKYVKTVETYAEAHGKRFLMDALTKCATAVSAQAGNEATALDLTEKAVKLIAEKTPTDMQIRILKALKSAQEKAGKTDLAKATDAKLANLEEQVDKEYLAKVPPFKPSKFQGRTKTTDKVAVFELFTGAQCPPCVAADVAFDALLKSYKSTELVMIQYHMHIPGPDPLTNPDTEARWKYYGNLRGVPSSLFNGKVAAGGGGGMANSEAKYKAYKDVINPILDEENAIKMSGSVTMKGDKIAIKVDVDGIKEANENLKLRFVLVEETVKFVGGNGIRLHHHVVRAMPGGFEGMAIKEKKDSKSAEVDLAELRKKLQTYLADFEAGGREFSNPDKPLAFKNLRVIAILQDDGSKEILHAVQMEVPETR